MTARRFVAPAFAALCVGAGALTPASLDVPPLQEHSASVKRLEATSARASLASPMHAIEGLIGDRSSAAPVALSYAPFEIRVPSQAPGGAQTGFGQIRETLPQSGEVREAIDAYRRGDLAAGDAIGEASGDTAARLAVEWAALRILPREAGLARIERFLAAHPAWPAAAMLRRRAEESLWAGHKSPDAVERFFADRAPETTLGLFAVARAELARGHIDKAAVLARDVWRDADLSPQLETLVLKDFGDYLTWADHKYRSDRLAYKGNALGAMRAAALAGSEVLALAKARESLNDKLIGALPVELRDDPSLLFARIQKLRREDKWQDAARLMLTAPRDAAELVDGDEWWIERRLLVRKLLDLGEPRLAYRIGALRSATARDQRIDEDFTAGWVALRFLADPKLADTQFALAEPLVITPISRARIAYWRGRAAEAQNDADRAKANYSIAAQQPTTFYGQLALAKLGRDTLPLQQPARVALGDQRDEAVRVIELLESVDATDLAGPLAIDMARTATDESQLAALCETLVEARDARLALAVGKLASQRGFKLDEFAFPVFGVPKYDAIAGSASAATVYAIARQESAFDPRAVSSAGAKGLMQMMSATARRTAEHKGVAYDENRLLSDPAFNAMLGAAHLGELATEHPGSQILSFAAYNAGGGRVKQWIAAHGDPRDPNVDPVDWIEMIPIAETRNYVQRVAENLQVYRARLNGQSRLAIEATLRDRNNPM